MIRVKRSSPSHPRIAKEGWEDLEPTQLMDLSRERIREATRTAKRCEDCIRNHCVCDHGPNHP